MMMSLLVQGRVIENTLPYLGRRFYLLTKIRES